MEYERMRKYADELTRHAPEPFRGYEISGDRIIETADLHTYPAG